MTIHSNHGVIETFGFDYYVSSPVPQTHNIVHVLLFTDHIWVRITAVLDDNSMLVYDVVLIRYNFKIASIVSSSDEYSAWIAGSH